MKKLVLLLCIVVSYSSVKAQSYSLQDIEYSLKSFSSHRLFIETSRILIGSYDTVDLNKTYFRIVLQGELLSEETLFGHLYQVIAFDARDISNDVVVVPMDIGGQKDRWDVILKTKKNLNLIHFINEQTNNYGVHFTRVYEDVNKINLMFTSADAANRFKNIAKAVFK